jgi:PAS domain S-box-containing protein
VNKTRIIIVEQDSTDAQNVENTLGKLGYQVVSIITDTNQAFEQVREVQPDLVLMNFQIEHGTDIVKTATQIRSKLDIPVIFSTTPQEAEEIEEAGSTPFQYVLKPCLERELKMVVEMALHCANTTTNQILAAREIQKSQHRFTSLVKLTPLGVLEFDNDFIITAWNPGAEQIFGHTAEEAIGRSTFDLLLPEYEYEAVKQVHLFKTPKASRNINDNKTKDGRIITCQWFNAPICDIGGKVVGLTALCQDITDQIKTETALKGSEEKYRNVVQNAIEAIIVIQDHRFEYFNPKAIELSGYSADELQQLRIEDVIHPEDREWVTQKQFQQLEMEQDVGFYTHRIITPEMSIRWIEVKAVIIPWNDRSAILIFFTDVTQKRRAEELMIQTEKMMSLGGLAAGMAHELNNPLGGILLGTQTILKRLSPDLPANQEVAEALEIDLLKLQHYLEKRKIASLFNGILESGRKAADIISSMLQFSRKSDPNRALTDLSVLLEEVLELASKDYNLKKKYDFRDIKVIREFDSRLPAVPCAPTEIEQVILNLLANAAWEMSEKESGDPPQIILRLKREPDMVRIEVEDNGPGISPEGRKRVFEPFYTTKPVGEGTGLGLSVSYMIVTNNHQGTMEVQSETGEGTRFIIRLPLKQQSNPEQGV